MGDATPGGYALIQRVSRVAASRQSMAKEDHPRGYVTGAAVHASRSWNRELRDASTHPAQLHPHKRTASRGDGTPRGNVVERCSHLHGFLAASGKEQRVRKLPPTAGFCVPAPRPRDTTGSR
ncbi:hypothetical protein NDU88_006032 [Pleurodeles waltl]|uniref:Uncharacterized protein n=1 Tax=Pleurodeles waltl TaxID=8319 RepID=A0AAV7MBR5_PLEWA|nr:hypothetical protein NDU88_006032 [Pleurodeles waltl]